MNTDTDIDTISLRDVRRLNVKDGDTLVLLSDQRLSGDTIGRLKHYMADLFPGHKTMVLDEGFDILVVEESDTV